MAAPRIAGTIFLRPTTGPTLTARQPSDADAHRSGQPSVGTDQATRGRALPSVTDS